MNMASWYGVKSGLRQLVGDEHLFAIDSYDSYNAPWYDFESRLCTRQTFGKSYTWEFLFLSYSLMPKDDYYSVMSKEARANSQEYPLLSIGIPKLHFMIEFKSDDGVKQTIYRSSIPVQTLPLYLRAQEEENNMYNDVLEIDHFDSTRVRIYADQNIDFLVSTHYPTFTYIIQKKK